MAEAKAQVRCPFCTRMADPEKVPGEGDIICVQCGLNLLTGQQIQRPGGDVPEASPARRRSAWLFAAAPALVVVLAASLGVIYFLTKDPVAEAIALARAGNTLEATRMMDARLEQQPADISARMLRGRLAWQAQDYARATQDFGAVLDQEPRNETAAALAMLAVSKTQGGDALARQTALYQRVLESQPDNVTAQRLLALALGASGRYDEQVAAMERLGAQAGEDAFSLQMRGAAMALLGRHSEAELNFSSAAAAGDTGGMATLAQGLLASMNGDDAKATELLASVQGGGEEVRSLAGARLGMLQMARGDYEPAVASLRSAAATGSNEDARFFHALSLRQVRLTQEALVALTEIRDARGKYAGPAALELTLMALETGDLEEAQENLRQAATSDLSASTRYLTIQGKIYLAQGQEPEAQQSFRQAIQADANYAPAHLEDGLLNVKRGITEQGIASLEKYLELAGDTTSGAVPEVRLLVSQLKQTSGTAGGGAQ